MKKLLFLFFFLLFLLPVGDVSAYTLADVSKHSTSNDCWVVFEDKVYNISTYVAIHKKYSEISGYCGRDITTAFKTMGGRSSDHSSSAYRLFETFNIGTIDPLVVDNSQPTVNDIVNTNTEASEMTSKTPYKLLLPILLTTAIYWVLNILSKKGKIKGFNILKFNAFITTIMFLLFLIPTFSFGIYLILRYEYPALYNIKFNILFWHGQLALFMGTLALNHYLQRFKIHSKQIAASV